MSAPTRSAVLELRDERRAMQEGHVFLDEKCLLLAAEMLRELALHERLQLRFLTSQATATRALQDAVGRHGLEGLEVHAAANLSAATVTVTPRLLMGVRLQHAELSVGEQHLPAAVNRSPEAVACRHAFLDLLRQATTLAAVRGNLERLHVEYRRASRRARALQDVLLPEINRNVAEIDARLEELEQDDAVSMRRGAVGASPSRRPSTRDASSAD